jgi:hypothetical protein
MGSIDELLRLFSGNGRAAQGQAGAGRNPVPPLTPEGRDTASQAARQALAPKQTDESHLIIRQFGQDGDVLQRSEELTHGAAGLKAVIKEVRVLTCTGELVEPKKICVICSDCGGHDSVVAHCRCGVALCRRCVHPEPSDGSPLCTSCHRRAAEMFNAWSAHDRQHSKEDSK